MLFKGHRHFNSDIAKMQASKTSGAKLSRPDFATARVTGALMLREMGSTYGQSSGGYIWAILSPLGVIILLSVGFSMLIRTPSLGTSFILFYATGYLPFMLYSNIAAKTGNALKYSRALLAYPRVLWLDAILARAALALLTNMMVFLIVVSSVIMTVDAHVLVEVTKIVEGLAIMFTTGLGVGMMNALLFGIFPVWSQVWSIISRPLFLASGVLFIFDSLPDTAQAILWWNPLIHGIGKIRSGFYPTYEAEYVLLPYAYVVGLVLVTVALLFLRKYHIDTIED